MLGSSRKSEESFLSEGNKRGGQLTGGPTLDPPPTKGTTEQTAKPGEVCGLNGRSVSVLTLFLLHTELHPQAFLCYFETLSH